MAKSTQEIDWFPQREGKENGKILPFVVEFRGGGDYPTFW